MRMKSIYFCIKYENVCLHKKSLFMLGIGLFYHSEVLFMHKGVGVRLY